MDFLKAFRLLCSISYLLEAIEQEYTIAYASWYWLH